DEEFGGQCRGVHGNERPWEIAVRVIVARGSVLARPGRAGDENRSYVRGGQACEVVADRPNRSARPDQCRFGGQKAVHMGLTRNDSLHDGPHRSRRLASVSCIPSSSLAANEGFRPW